MNRPRAPQRWSRRWWSGTTPIPTFRTAVVIVAAIPIGLLIASPLGWLVLVATIMTLAVIDAMRTPAPWKVGVSRALPQVLALDGVGQLTWQVNNPSTL